MKYISFSLWGSNPMYCIGAMENIKLAREYYPDWKCVFYVDDTVSKSVTDDLLRSEALVNHVGHNDRGAFWGMFWRFLINDEPDMEAFVSRDCDSRLNIREKLAVDEWMVSDKCLHIMHDHYGHRSVPILGGMWGAKKGCIDNITEKILRWGKYSHKGIDQHFLWGLIWPTVKDRCMSHGIKWSGRWGESRPFPEHPLIKYGGTFVGEIFDENNKPVIS